MKAAFSEGGVVIALPLLASFAFVPFTYPRQHELAVALREIGRIERMLFIIEWLTMSKMNAWPKDTLFVTYCAGPHRNGAARGALRLAELGRPVKIMVGGITDWLDEGFELATWQ